MNTSFFKVQIPCLLILSLLKIWFGWDQMLVIVSGYLLSFLFVFSSVWLISYVWKADNQTFIKSYFFVMALRFLVVLVLFAVLIGVLKFDEIFFTVSFIISYLYQSVTEIFFFQKTLQSEVKSANDPDP